MHDFFGLLLLVIFPFSSRAVNGTIDSELSEYICELHRYENPINRDHFYYPEAGSTIFNFSRKFNFDDYHYDGYIGGILSKEGYAYFIAKHPEAREKFMPVYHGYHEDMKHNYYSKPYEPYNQAEGVVFYVSRQKGYQMANYPLWTLDGQPIDFVGDLGYDTIYTRNLTEHLLPDKEDYVMYRILGYIWSIDEVNAAVPNTNKLLKPATFESNLVDTGMSKHRFIHGQYQLITPLYQFFDEKDQNYYYKTVIDRSSQDRANFIDVVAYIVKEQFAANFSAPCNSSSGVLIPLVSAYAKTDVYSTTVLFLSDETYKTAEEEMKTKFTNRTVLGYVTHYESACEPHYKLNIYKSWNESTLLSSSGGSLDQFVYIAPMAARDTHSLFYEQVFWLW